MVWKRNASQQAVTKVIGATTVMTIGGTVTHASSAFDLGVSRRYSAAKAIYTGVKGGTAGTMDVTMTVTTGPSNAAAGAFMAANDVGTSLATGHAPNSASEISVTRDIDLTSSLCDRWIKVTVNATGSASDTVSGRIILVLSGAREEPVSTLGTNVADTT